MPSDYDIRLRPVAEPDLDTLGRFDTEPELSEPFEWRGYKDPNARRRRWEHDGYLGAEDSMLVVALPGGAFAGFVTWRSATDSGPSGTFRLGIGLLPEHRGKGIGTRAQQLLADHLFATTTVHRLEATTEVDNVAEQRALERSGFTKEGLIRGGGFVRGGWRDGYLYSRLRDDPPPDPAPVASA